jgi:hypothetical protein
MPPPMPDRGRPAAAKPAAPASMPPVVTPARTVAITAAKASAAPPASAPRRRRSFTGESRAVAEKSRTTTELAQPVQERNENHEGSRPPARGPQRPRRRTLDETTTAPQMPAAADPATVFDDEDTRVLRNKPDGGIEDIIERSFERRSAGHDGEVEEKEQEEEPDAVTIVPRSARATLPHENGATPVVAFTPAHVAEPAPAREPAVTTEAPEAAVAAVAPAPAAQLTEHPTDDLMSDDGPISGPPSQKTKVWTQVPDMSQGEPSTERPPSSPDVEPPRRAAPAPQPPKRLDTLPALRVAVLATAVPGDVRLIALGTHDEAPPGAAIAVLVPLSAADGEAVARLFKGLE